SLISERNLCRDVIVWMHGTDNYRNSVVDIRVNRAIFAAFCCLLVSTPIWAASPREDQSQDDQQPPPKHNRQVVHRVDPATQLRHAMRDEINSGLVGIVSEGTDYTVDLALALASKDTHLRLLPIAGTGAQQNAKDVMFARGVDFAILQT